MIDGHRFAIVPDRCVAGLCRKGTVTVDAGTRTAIHGLTFNNSASERSVFGALRRLRYYS